MRPVAKAGLVVVGYVAAFAVAWLAVSVYAFATSGPDRQQYGAMFAFGDSLLVLAVFGLAAVPPTGAALYFLRGRRGFWVTLSVGSLAIASTGLAAFLYSSSPFATLRILVAPLFVLFFLLAGLVAPNRPARIALIAATSIEAVAFACAVLSWLHPFQHR